MGESYGGHYVPNTARAIEEGNAKLPVGSREWINLRGFAVGNGCVHVSQDASTCHRYTDWALDFNANVPNGRFHALTSEKLFEEVPRVHHNNNA